MPSIIPLHASGSSVLVVEDSAVQRRHAVQLCRDLGIELVHEAENGRKALELMAGLPVPPGLLIVDLEMPEMDGIELIETLQKLGLRVPIVLASSREDALIDSVQAMGLTVVSGLQKPLTLEALRAAIKDCAAFCKTQSGPAQVRPLAN
jgi:CheY-like chemotaxis protein